ncbi:MAG: malectin domain-containing carbohydrate-binding protein [Paludibacter sp.]|nr:malectin domain-containing carbohydrate-binding protein [Paludibacter sp.]
MLLFSIFLSAQSAPLSQGRGVGGEVVVSQSKMSEIYEQVKTPYKYGLVLAPTTNNYKIDCPTVFQKDGKWFMTFVIYNGKTGTDGRGYETWLAESDNLLEWKTKGRILSFREGVWDMNQRGGFPSLPDMEWGGSYELQPFKGKNWMTYIGGANAGYEAGPLSIGLAWTDEKNLSKAEEWNSIKKPILSSKDKDAQWFENLTQYKSTIYWDKSKTLGAPFVMFYNAGGIHPETNLKGERIGIALSNDMKHWKRYVGNPVFTHEIQGMITGDAQIQKFGDVFVMFYFSAFNPNKTYKAYNTFACSYDLIHWFDWKGDDLIIPSKKYDDLFAHKSYVINHNGVVYHFYCAVNKFDQRGIAVATSKPLGRSTLNFPIPEVKDRRTTVNLNEGWKTWMKNDTLKVNIPHNWDDYYGYRQLTHGNLHGTATYIKIFTAPIIEKNKSTFLRFEGVGTYATVILNGKNYGRFLSGRTTFTIDVSKEIKPGTTNQLTVIAEHPEMIWDMPWVCGGCSSEWGFSEGSQPLGIFRPVVLEVTDNIRIEPFGVHVWNNAKADSIFIETEVKNYSNKTEEVELVNKLNNEDGIAAFRLAGKVILKAGETKIIRRSSPINDQIRWSTERPYLYKLASMIKRGDNVTTDEIITSFGIRTISWPVKRNDEDGRFYLNEKPFFINGTCEYEHQFGQSHAFSDDQIYSRVKQIKAAGFNAFRDAHQPHNLEYQRLLDENGLLEWTQFSAHIWYDTPQFRENFKNLLRQWVKERRNSPSLIMWGLQNESVLPKDFAEECSAIIREMDPTANDMRVITTCNGGEGTDWDVIQNWSGTYGGNIENYGQELIQKNQLLNGEYGAWRSLGLHTEPAEFDENGIWSEDRATQLLEKKIRLVELVKDSVCGQFQWVFSSHDNPGRRQPDEMYRVMDKVGPFNYKGLVSPWEEPTDAYYMYRANYVSAKKDPMVYIVSHTWPNRFKKRTRATIEVYSNCDSVKLYNDAVDSVYLGRKKNNGIGTHFMWENRDIRYNVLRAIGFYGGKTVVEDVIVMNNLEKAPHFDVLFIDSTTSSHTINKVDNLKGDPNYNYLYRLNCGGDAYTDEFGQNWLKDDTLFSTSWAADFKELNPYQASQRVTYDPIRGTKDWSLFGHFRFGRHKLKYNFAVPDGNYRVELYFTEPWHGTGGGVGTDCEGLRLFDVAVNDSVVLNDLDIWAESGHDAALKKVVNANVKGGKLEISFPEVKAGQAIISAIAIASTDKSILTKAYQISDWSWDEADKNVLVKTPKEMLPEDENVRQSAVYKVESAILSGKYKKITLKNIAGIKFSNSKTAIIQWNISPGLAQVYALRFNYMNISGEAKVFNIQLVDSKGVILKNDEITFPETPEKWKQISTTTGTYINAGNYKVVISGENVSGLAFTSLEIQ